jgi:GNAT superfamily N-acetyltransferase
MRCYIGGQFPDARVVEGTPDDDVLGDAQLLWESGSDDRGFLHVSVNRAFAPACGDVWFVSVPARGAGPRLHNLVAFDTGDLPDGTIIDDPTFSMMSVRSDDQAGAIQWDADTGNVVQLFVQPAKRRADIGTVLIYTASAWHQSHGWPGRLHNDGKRTLMGEAFAVSLIHGQRIERWREVSPPMDL